MPFVLIIFGEMLFVSGIAGTYSDFFGLLKSDFTGQNSFIYWLGAIALIGALGYVPTLKPLSNAMLVLVLLVLIVHDYKNNPNIFASFNIGLASTTTPQNILHEANNTVSLTPMVNQAVSA